MIKPHDHSSRISKRVPETKKSTASQLYYLKNFRPLRGGEVSDLALRARSVMTCPTLMWVSIYFCIYFGFPVIYHHFTTTFTAFWYIFHVFNARNDRFSSCISRLRHTFRPQPSQKAMWFQFTAVMAWEIEIWDGKKCKLKSGTVKSVTWNLGR